MKTLWITGLGLCLSAFSLAGVHSPGNTGQGTGYAPNDGTAKPGNPGTLMKPKADLGVTGLEKATTETNENLERSNTSPNPIPTDTTLQHGKTRTGPYKSHDEKQSQEATKKKLDYRASPKTDHLEQNASENQ